MPIFVWKTKHNVSTEDTLVKCLADMIHPTCKSIVIYKAGIVKQLLQMMVSLMNSVGLSFG